MMSESQDQKLYVKQKFKQVKCCVLVTTYNNSQNIDELIQSIQKYCDDTILVNDGCTDNTEDILSNYPQLIILSHPINKGKGVALKSGFEKAVELGFEYVISIDGNGQHFPKDFISFLDKIEEHPDSLIIGARHTTFENAPYKISLGNKFSNFWFWVQTGISLPDTQSGYRLYPVKRLEKIKLFSTKIEIEMMVKAAWRGISVISIPISVHHSPAEQRVSNFIPVRDRVLISFLNTYLVLLAAFYWRPAMLLRKMTAENLKKIWIEEVVAAHESIEKKAFSVGVGLFFGIAPIWGFQFASAIFSAIFFKLNKTVVLLSAQISFPPLIPFILYVSVKTGELVLNKPIKLSIDKLLSSESLNNLYVYVIGAFVLSVLVAITGFLLTWIFLKLFGYKPHHA